MNSELKKELRVYDVWLSNPASHHCMLCVENINTEFSGRGTATKHYFILRDNSGSGELDSWKFKYFMIGRSIFCMPYALYGWDSQKVFARFDGDNSYFVLTPNWKDCLQKIGTQGIIKPSFHRLLDLED